jgi:glucose-1-phosphatase
MNDNKTKAIIFDLGGVLYDISFARAQKQLSTLTTKEIDFSLTSQSDLFSKYESGLMTTEEFLHDFRVLLEVDSNTTDGDLISAWNSLLVGLIVGRVELLSSLKKSYKLYLLSNINELHYKAVKEECKELFSQFDFVFPSYKMGMRKPEIKIYQSVLADIELSPDEVIYFDDAPQHCQAAISLGIPTYRITETESLEYYVSTLALKRL